jgi:hypothetical protein
VAACAAIGTLARGQTTGATAPANARPHIILVVVTDLGWDETGYAGHPT